MSRFSIPTSYKVMGRRIKVVLDDDNLTDNGCFGSFHNGQGLIRLRSVKGRYPKELAEQTFVHEALHSALDSMGHELNDDEKFVSTLSGLLHQILTTGKGDLLHD